MEARILRWSSGRRSSRPICLPRRSDARSPRGESPPCRPKPSYRTRMSSTAVASKRILVVDDESAILQTLRYDLARSGYQVSTAGDGRTALALVASEEPNLVIL